MSKGGVGGVVARGPISESVGHLVVNNEWFEGCCDAGDASDGGEECIISITTGSGGHGKRIDWSCG